MGRPPLSPRKWLKNEEEMLNWLEERFLAKNVALTRLPPGYRYESLLQSLEAFVSEDGGKEAFSNLKQYWRRYKSVQAKGRKSIQLYLDETTRDHLCRLSKRTSVHETISRLITEENQGIRQRDRDIKREVEARFRQQETSAKIKAERLQTERDKLRLDKQTLEAKRKALHDQMSNFLLLLAQYEIATGTAIDEDLGLGGDDQLKALERHGQLLRAYEKHLEARASVLLLQQKAHPAKGPTEPSPLDELFSLERPSRQQD